MREWFECTLMNVLESVFDTITFPYRKINPSSETTLTLTPTSQRQQGISGGYMYVR